MGTKIDARKKAIAELTAAKADMDKQIAHFQKLGSDKPDDHEYNMITAGYKRIVAEWSALYSYLVVK